MSKESVYIPLILWLLEYFDQSFLLALNPMKKVICNDHKDRADSLLSRTETPRNSKPIFLKW